MSKEEGVAEVGRWRRKSARILALEERDKERRKSTANAKNTDNIHSSKGQVSGTDNLDSFQYQQLQHPGDTMEPSPLKCGRKQKRLKDLDFPYLDRSRSQQDGEVSEGGNSSTRSDKKLSGLTSMPEKFLLVAALDIMQRRDTNDIFAQPVDPEEVENYYLIIKDPMDFGTMRTKLEEGKYTDLEQFEKDMFLMFSNAMHFNSSTTIYYKEARAMQGLAERVLYTLRTDPYKLESEFPITRGRPGKKSSRAKETRGSRRKTSRRTGVRNGASSLGPRGGRDTALPKRETNPHRHWSSFCSENEKLVSSVYNAAKTLTKVEEKGNFRYTKSLLRYVKGLGPTAKRLAAMKLIKCLPSQTQFSTAQRMLLPAPPFAQKPTYHNAQFPITFLQTSTGIPDVLQGRNTFLNLNIQASPNDLMPPPKEPIFGQARHGSLLGEMPMLNSNVVKPTSNFNIFGSSSRENRTYPSGDSTINIHGTTCLRGKAVVPQQEVADNQEGQCWLASHLKVIPVENPDSPDCKKFMTLDMMEDDQTDNDELSANWRSRLKGFVHRGNTFLKSFDLFPSPSETSGSTSAQGMANFGDHWQHLMNSTYSHFTQQTGDSSESFGTGTDFATLQKLLNHEYTPLPSYDELGVVHQGDGNSANYHGRSGTNPKQRYLKDVDREPNLSLQL